jgi:hypothetical protein
MLDGMWMNISLLNRFQEQEGGINVELDEDATYHVKEVGSISF